MLGEQLFGTVHDWADDALAQVVAVAGVAVAGGEDRVVGAGGVGGLVLGRDLAQQREHVDLAHTGVGLVAPDLDAAVGEVLVAAEQRPGRGRLGPPSIKQRDRRAAPVVLDFGSRSSSRAASSITAMCSALSRYTGRGFVTFSRRRLPLAGLAGISSCSTATSRIWASRNRCMLIERFDSGRSLRW
jgi:hypothetical protein